jgi:hypothetical protein
MGITIEQPTTAEELTQFVEFADVANAGRSAYWPALAAVVLPLLQGTGPSAEGRTIMPLVARDDGRIVARAAAVVDQRYIELWDEPLGHVAMFEALPGSTHATCVLMNGACDWLRAQGMTAARAGFGPGEMDSAFVIDEYDLLPPMLGLRQNPAHYHALLKEARFETERAMVDYKIAVTAELVECWKQMLDGARHGGYRIASLREVPTERRAPEFGATFNDAFRSHWGMSPITEAEFAENFEMAELTGLLDVSMLAYSGDDPVGVIIAMPELSMLATLAPGRELSDAERLNFLAIGVRDVARGRGVNLAMAARCFLELVARGATHVSYTGVMDDNWPSRRTAEKLGASVCANYVVYRRRLL